jgi:hypothetical protein
VMGAAISAARDARNYLIRVPHGRESVCSHDEPNGNVSKRKQVLSLTCLRLDEGESRSTSVLGLRRGQACPGVWSRYIFHSARTYQDLQLLLPVIIDSGKLSSDLIREYLLYAFFIGSYPYWRN